MYAAPAEGNGPNAEELEQYLLGKKRVDKLLKGNEEKMMAAPSEKNPGGSFTSIQNANSARDTMAKIREDPLLAIKRQEQAQYEKLLKNPKRLKELRAMRDAASTPAHGAPKKSKKDETKEERRIRKEGKRERDGHQKRRRESDDEAYGSKRRQSGSGSRSPSPPRRRPMDESRRDDDRHLHRDERRDYDYSSRRHQDDRREGSDRRDSHRDDRSDRRPRSRSPPPPPRESFGLPRPDHAPPPSRAPYERSSYPTSRPSASSFNDRRPAPSGPTPEQEAAHKLQQAERLAAMQSSAAALNDERNARLGKLEAEDKKQLAAEELNRASKGKDVAPKFLRDQEKQVFGGMDLAERMRRTGRVGVERNEA